LPYNTWLASCQCECRNSILVLKGFQPLRAELTSAAPATAFSEPLFLSSPLPPCHQRIPAKGHALSRPRPFLHPPPLGPSIDLPRMGHWLHGRSGGFCGKIPVEKWKRPRSPLGLEGSGQEEPHACLVSQAMLPSSSL
jgi:hypothetical protein